jgi:hypothetical protein
MAQPLFENDLLARILEIVMDEQRLEAYERTQTKRRPQEVDTMRSWSFGKIANLVLFPETIPLEFRTDEPPPQKA